MIFGRKILLPFRKKLNWICKTMPTIFKLNQILIKIKVMWVFISIQNVIKTAVLEFLGYVLGLLLVKCSNTGLVKVVKKTYFEIYSVYNKLWTRFHSIFYQNYLNWRLNVFI